MGGTIRGLTNVAASEETSHKTRSVMFKHLFDAFEAHPNATRIALQHGTNGSGTGYWYESAPFGQQAWAVYRMNTSAARTWPYYVLIQGAAGSNGSGSAATASWTAAPGDPAQGNGGSSGVVGIACAIGLGGDENPWNGDTGNAGADDKGGSAAFPLGSDGNGTVWRTPAAGTGVLVFPRSNSAGGTDVAVQHNMALITETSENGPRVQHIVMDDDSIWIVWDEGMNNKFRMIYCGLYNPRPGLTVDRPFMMRRGDLPINTGTSNADREGIAFPDSADGTPVRNCEFVRETTAGGNHASSPCRAVEPAAFVTEPDSIHVTEGSPVGFCGLWDGAPYVAGRFSSQVSADRQWAYFGDNTTNPVCQRVPWDGVTHPKSVVHSSAGYSWTRTP